MLPSGTSTYTPALHVTTSLHDMAPHPAQVIAASTDTEECHLAWIKTPRNRGGLGYMQIPIIADVTKEISARWAPASAQ
jgi:alkyl hydroperoxide reductase subunit AhpC